MKQCDAVNGCISNDMALPGSESCANVASPQLQSARKHLNMGPRRPKYRSQGPSSGSSSDPGLAGRKQQHIGPDFTVGGRARCQACCRRRVSVRARKYPTCLFLDITAVEQWQTRDSASLREVRRVFDRPVLERINRTRANLEVARTQRTAQLNSVGASRWSNW